MGIVIGFLPIVLWLVAVIMAVAIITFTIGRGHIFMPRAKRPATEPVDWSMVKMRIGASVRKNDDDTGIR